MPMPYFNPKKCPEVWRGSLNESRRHRPSASAVVLFSLDSVVWVEIAIECAVGSTNAERERLPLGLEQVEHAGLEFLRTGVQTVEPYCARRNGAA